jgi:hypothetical protein
MSLGNTCKHIDRQRPETETGKSASLPQIEVLHAGDRANFSAKPKLRPAGEHRRIVPVPIALEDAGGIVLPFQL